MLLLQGQEHKAIAARLGMQLDTLRWHMANIYAKLQVDGLDGLRAWVNSGPSR